MKRIRAAAAADDIKEIWAMYVQLFSLTAVCNGELQSVLSSEEGAQEAWLELADLGVEKFIQCSEEVHTVSIIELFKCKPYAIRQVLICLRIVCMGWSQH